MDLKQSPRMWFGIVAKFVRRFVLQHDKKDNFISFLLIERKRILLVVYIDDIVIKGDD